jgi:hypothetical protein
MTIRWKPRHITRKARIRNGRRSFPDASLSPERPLRLFFLARLTLRVAFESSRASCALRGSETAILRYRAPPMREQRVRPARIIAPAPRAERLPPELYSHSEQLVFFLEALCHHGGLWQPAAAWKSASNLHSCSGSLSLRSRVSAERSCFLASSAPARDFSLQNFDF